jgi:general secretion pathway protein G
MSLEKPAGRYSRRGFTVIEVLIVLAIIGVLGAIALPKYQDYRERIRVAQAITDIRAANAVLRSYMNDNNAPPPSLAEIGWGGKTDPWGQPYEYLNILGASSSVIGKARKNKNLVPINSYYDLYSRGKDGFTSAPLTAGPSRDDVVLANDGGFVGLASDYE